MKQTLTALVILVAIAAPVAAEKAKVIEPTSTCGPAISMGDVTVLDARELTTADEIGKFVLETVGEIKPLRSDTLKRVNRFQKTFKKKAAVRAAKIGCDVAVLLTSRSEITGAHVAEGGNVNLRATLYVTVLYARQVDGGN